MLHASALSFVKLCWPLWEICHAPKIKITHTPPTYALLLHWGRRKHMSLHLDPPKKVLLLYWKWTQKHACYVCIQINASSSCCYLSNILVAEKRHGAMQKLFIKKRKRKKKLRKNGQVSEIFKTIVFCALAESFILYLHL